MKTTSNVCRIILLLIVGMIAVTANAQEKVTNVSGQKIHHEVDPNAGAYPSHPIPPPPPPPPPPYNDGLNDHPPALDLPDLSADQQAKIKKADLKNMSEMTPLRNQMREKRARMATIMTTSPIDLKAAEQVADEIGTTAAAMLKLQIRHDQDLRSILTPDQQVIFDSRPKPWLRRP